MKTSNRILINTGALYFRMLITVFITLFSTRIIINVLGVNDYGIYNLIAGITAMLSFLSGVMTFSSQRFLSFELGVGNIKKLNDVFATSIRLHLYIGILVTLILEIVGVYILNYKLNIPLDRIYASNFVLQFMIIDVFYSITSAPYDALINSNENIEIIAFIYLIESFAKLGIALVLNYILIDKLIFYSLSLAAVYIFSRYGKQFYCRFKYKNIRIDRIKTIDNVLLKKMFLFSTWNGFGAFCDIARNQGIGVVMNLFFGVAINASYAIAIQVSGQLKYFSNSLLMSINPQILKAQGAGEKERMLELSLLASKISFFLLSLFSIPLFIEMPFILKIWLGVVPENTVLFCRLIIVQCLVAQITMGLHTAIQSIGIIKNYQLITGSLFLITLPIGYMLLRYGFSPSVILIISIIMEFIASCFKVIFLKSKSNFVISDFVYKVLFRGTIPILISVLIFVAQFYSLQLSNKTLEVLLMFITWVLTTLTSFYYLGLSRYEKKFINGIISSVVNKVIGMNK